MAKLKPLGGALTRLGFGSIPFEELKSRYAPASSGSRFADVNGFDVHYRDEGPRDAPALLLIHGACASLHTWDGWTAKLVQRHRVVRLDIPGFGLTGPPRVRTKYTVDMLLETVEAFVDRIGLGSYGVIGISLGGFVAWNLAARHPYRVTSLVLVAAAGYRQEKLPSLISIATTPGAAKFARLGQPRLFVRKALHQVYHDSKKLHPDAELRYYELAQRKGNALVTIKIFRAMVRANDKVLAATPDVVKAIQCPVLVLWGKEDTWIPVDQVERWKRDVEGERLTIVVYPGVGHVPVEEAPVLSYKDVDEFLSRHYAADGSL